MGVGISIPVYLWIPVRGIRWTTAQDVIYRRGYAGVTYYEEVPDGPEIHTLVVSYANFSVQCRTKQDCISGDVILPDGRVMPVKKYLGVY